MKRLDRIPSGVCFTMTLLLVVVFAGSACGVEEAD
jgi:hypothetical protein